MIDENKFNHMTMREKIAYLKSENEELNDKYLRSVADFQNYKRNKESEIERIKNIASKDAILMMVDLVDDFRRSFDYNPNNSDVNTLYLQLLNKLQKCGAEIYGSAGDEFDPDLHDAISVVYSENNDEVVYQVVNVGCRLNGEIIRHAKVVVAK